MTGSWRLIIGFGGFGAFLTFLFSLSNNPFGTTILRSFYAFVVFAALAYAVRFVLGHLIIPAVPAQEAANLSDEDRGAVLDLTTPDEGDSLSEMMKEQWSGSKDDSEKGFQPLQPKKLVSIDDPNPEDVVQAIRRLTDE